MRTLRIENVDRDAELGDRVLLADGFWTRLRGMIGRPAPAPGEGLLLAPSQAVHMWWMRYPLDVAMLDADRSVIAVYRELSPGDRTRMHWKARYALELPPGTLEATGTAPGDTLHWT